MRETYGGVFVGAEQVKIHDAVSIDIVSVEQAIEMMIKYSFSGSGEAIIFQLPMTLKRYFGKLMR